VLVVLYLPIVDENTHLLYHARRAQASSTASTSFAGRQWAMDMLRDRVLATPTPTDTSAVSTVPRGTLLVAEPGFGKSAIVKRILACSETAGGTASVQPLGADITVLGAHVCSMQQGNGLQAADLIQSLWQCLHQQLPRQFSELCDKEVCLPTH
jgi:hypothetical protein